MLMVESARFHLYLKVFYAFRGIIGCLVVKPTSCIGKLIYFKVQGFWESVVHGADDLWSGLFLVALS